jgi:hypothetical protein
VLSKNYMSGSNVRLGDIFSVVVAYFIQTCYVCMQYTVQKEAVTVTFCTDGFGGLMVRMLASRS